jgi:hypothetical protein
VTMARPVRKQFHASRRSTAKRAFERIFAMLGWCPGSDQGASP